MSAMSSESVPSFQSNKMVQNNAERCAKYRAENSEKFKLIAAIQQFKRSKELASESLDAEKMRRAASVHRCVGHTA